jgi:uncharacterized membrane-anchored protein YitT (DUF2179 family)
MMLALGLHLLHQARLITGGMAGLALLLSYLAPRPARCLPCSTCRSS